MKKVFKVFLIIQGITSCILATLCTLAAFAVVAQGGPIASLVIPAIINWLAFGVIVFDIKRFG
jgi:hypothetical protein